MFTRRPIRRSWCLSIGVLFLFAQPVFLSATDRDALISLYTSTAGDSWTNKEGWKDEPTLADGFNSDPCVEPVWYGVSCTGGSVARINLSDNKLTGGIPAALGNLSNLLYLYLHENQLTREIPVELANLSDLGERKRCVPCFASRGSSPPREN